MAASIVCGVDGSPDSQAALRVAAGLASRLGLRLVVAHVVDSTHVPYAAAAPFGRTAGRDRGAFKSAFLGSVSNDLVGVARCPVLIVPPGAAE